jgi:uncharacterized protein (DUF488 family)
VSVLRDAGVRTLVDVRRFPGSRNNPQFDQPALRQVLEEGGITHRHAVELGGRLAGEPAEERFGCPHVAAFRSYAARMRTERWEAALAAALAEPVPCFMCSLGDALVALPPASDRRASASAVADVKTACEG